MTRTAGPPGARQVARGTTRWQRSRTWVKSSCHPVSSKTRTRSCTSSGTTAPVLWSSAVGGWVLTRYDDVVVTFKDTDTYGNAGRMTRVLNHLEPAAQEKLTPFRKHYETQGLIHSDPPDHTRIRRLVLKAFTPPAIEAMRPADPVDRRRPARSDGAARSRRAHRGVRVRTAGDGARRDPRRAPLGRARGSATGRTTCSPFQGRNKPSAETLFTSQAMLIEAREYLAELIAVKRAEPGWQRAVRSSSRPRPTVTSSRWTSCSARPSRSSSPATRRPRRSSATAC